MGKEGGSMSRPDLKERIAAEIEAAKAAGTVHATCSTTAIDGIVYERNGEVVGYTPHREASPLEPAPENFNEEFYRTEERVFPPDGFNLTPEERAIKEAREREYGDPFNCHVAIGDVWNTIMAQRMHRNGGFVVFDPATVALMLAAMKIVRIAYAGGKDSFDDAHVYLKFAEAFAEKR
jgi:hypothetical protein